MLGWQHLGCSVSSSCTAVGKQTPLGLPWEVQAKIGTCQSSSVGDEGGFFFVSSPYQAPCRLYEQKQMVGTRTFNSNSLFLLPARGARWAVIKIEIPFLEPRRASGNTQLQGCPILTGSAQHGVFFGPTGVVLWLLSRTLTENPSGSLKVASWLLIACVRHQNTTRLGAFTHRAKTRQARYEVEGQFLPMDNLGN